MLEQRKQNREDYVYSKPSHGWWEKFAEIWGFGSENARDYEDLPFPWFASLGIFGYNGSAFVAVSYASATPPRRATIVLADT